MLGTREVLGFLEFILSTSEPCHIHTCKFALSKAPQNLQCVVMHKCKFCPDSSLVEVPCRVGDIAHCLCYWSICCTTRQLLRPHCAMFPGMSVCSHQASVSFPCWISVLCWPSLPPLMGAGALVGVAYAPGKVSVPRNVMRLTSAHQSPVAFLSRSHAGHLSCLSTIFSMWFFVVKISASLSPLEELALGCGARGVQTCKFFMYSVASLFWGLSRVLLLAECGTWLVSSRTLSFCSDLWKLRGLRLLAICCLASVTSISCYLFVKIPYLCLLFTFPIKRFNRFIIATLRFLFINFNLGISLGLLLLVIFFCGTGIWTQSFTFAKLILLLDPHLQFIWLWYFWSRILWTVCPGGLQEWSNLSTSSS
jgi:hypothetical protein